MVKSPLTNKEAKVEITFDNKKVIDNYKNEFGIDVSSYLKNADPLLLFRCEETGYRFFFPNSLAGDGDFYHQLSEISWYYREDKWEYALAYDFIDSNSKILDIGCGAGYFLKKMKTKGCDVHGLELNEDAQKKAEAEGLDVKKELIQTHAQNHQQTYDYVTFFQVLEHIGDIYSFIQSAIACTKIGGYVIIAVPNNDPYYLTYDKDHTLNLPPHHMGWWNGESLKNLENIFPLESLKIEKEPLQHFNTFTNILIREKITQNPFWVKVLNPFVKTYVHLFKKNFNGSHIMAIYRRTA